MSAFCITENVALAPRTTLELGGNAEHFVEATDDAHVVEAIRFAEAKRLPITVLGGGSNVLVSDRGVRGVVVAMRSRGVSKKDDGHNVCVELTAGESWDDFVANAVGEGLSGVETLSGIPGLVGATPIQNVGAYGSEIADTLERVTALDRLTKSTVTFSRAECEFRYRDSMFKRTPDRYVVLRVTFRLSRTKPGAPRYAELQRALAARSATPSVADIRETVLTLRRSKSMVIDANDPNRRSAGSFFLNPIVSKQEAARIASTHDGLPQFEQEDGRVKLAAAWLIEKSGITKGMRRGHVGVSTNHALALVHHGGGRAEELLLFAREIRAAVQSRFGVTLVPEPVLLGFDSSAL
jgi:UDP-N-acetylmuramate dehydrogenase